MKNYISKLLFYLNCNALLSTVLLLFMMHDVLTTSSFPIQTYKNTIPKETNDWKSNLYMQYCLCDIDVMRHFPIMQPQKSHKNHVMPFYD